MAIITKAEVRASTNDLTDVAVYSDTLLDSVINAVEQLFRDYTKVAWGGVEATVSAVGDGSKVVHIPFLYLRSVDEVREDGVVVSLDSFRVESATGLMYRIDGNVFKSEVVYSLDVSHGPLVMPADLKLAHILECQALARLRVNKGFQRSSGNTINTATGNFNYPNWSGKWGFSGDADVLRIANRYRVPDGWLVV